ncbi:hypothetical protein CRYUN_Cryun09bG0007700 [Craigia yunnanensis]
MSTKNRNGEGSKPYCPEGDASKNEHRPQPQVNKAQLEAEDSDQDLTKTISDFKMKGVKPDSSEGQRLGPVIGNFEESVFGKNPPVPNKEGLCSREDVSMYEHGAQLNVNLARLETDSLRRYLRHFKIEGINSYSSREQMLNAVQQHFASQPPLNERQVIPKFIDAVRDAPKNKHRPQPKGNKAQLEAEDSDNDLRKTMSDFKMKGVKPDSSRGQRLEPLTAHFEESANEKNPQAPNKEGLCSRGDVSMYEHGAQLNVNLARL